MLVAVGGCVWVCGGPRGGVSVLCLLLACAPRRRQPLPACAHYNTHVTYTHTHKHTWMRVEVADDVDVPAIARRVRLCHEDAVERQVLREGGQRMQFSTRVAGACERDADACCNRKKKNSPGGQSAPAASGAPWLALLAVHRNT